MTRASARSFITISVAVLAAYVIVRSVSIPGSAHFASNAAMIAVLAALAMRARLTIDEIGLSAAALPAGARAGAIAIAVVAAVVTLAIWVVGSDAAFVQDRTSLSTGAMLFQAFVQIPIATVAFEELAFRGLLAPLFHRITTPTLAVTATALLFGLWHVPAAVAGGGSIATVGGTFAATVAAGVTFQMLKDRSGSLLAPAMAHWATNGLALIIAWSFATRA